MNPTNPTRREGWALLLFLAMLGIVIAALGSGVWLFLR